MLGQLVPEIIWIDLEKYTGQIKSGAIIIPRIMNHIFIDSNQKRLTYLKWALADMINRIKAANH